jgi:hypothetical protein
MEFNAIDAKRNSIWQGQVMKKTMEMTNEELSKAIVHDHGQVARVKLLVSRVLKNHIQGQRGKQ